MSPRDGAGIRVTHSLIDDCIASPPASGGVKKLSMRYSVAFSAVEWLAGPPPGTRSGSHSSISRYLAAATTPETAGAIGVWRGRGGAVTSVWWEMSLSTLVGDDGAESLFCVCRFGATIGFPLERVISNASFHNPDMVPALGW